MHPKIRLLIIALALAAAAVGGYLAATWRADSGAHVAETSRSAPGGAEPSSAGVSAARHAGGRHPGHMDPAEHVGHSEHAGHAPNGEQMGEDHGAHAAHGAQGRQGESASADRRASSERRVLYWYDPMRPDVHFDKPGRSPFMDMDLVPKYADGGAEADFAVTIDPRMVQNLGIRTAPVVRGELASRVQAVGALGVDEHRLFAVQARADGWIESLEVRAVGDPVRRGARLAGIYSPELYAAQAEFVLAAESEDAQMIAAARRRLALLGVPEAQIERVQRAGRPERQVAVTAPVDGVVTELNVREGQQVDAATPLMRIADLSRLWVSLEVPETQAALLEAGQSARVRVAALPGRQFTGTVDYVYPTLETATRTVTARVVLANPEGRLRPGMFAQVTVQGATNEALLVPSEAVIRTGRRDVVIVAEAPDRFVPVAVELGPEREGRIAVQSGLKEGQQVVVSGQFLIDSEASLRGAFTRMQAPATGHEGHQP